MAGVVVHLAVADATFKKLNIKNLPLYYAGNVAPDCIHARRNYKREMKKHTHLRDNIRDWEFLSEENQNLFHQRLKTFEENYCNKGTDADLYTGYLVHLITDEIFMRTIRQECVKEAEKCGILQTDRRFFDYMMRELNGADTIAAKSIKFINDPVEMMRKSFGCSVRDYITETEMKESMEWIVDNYFSEKDTFENPVFLNLNMLEGFVCETEKEIYRLKTCW